MADTNAPEASVAGPLALDSPMEEEEEEDEAPEAGVVDKDSAGAVGGAGAGAVVDAGAGAQA